MRAPRAVVVVALATGACGTTSEPGAPAPRTDPKPPVAPPTQTAEAAAQPPARPSGKGLAGQVAATRNRLAGSPQWTTYQGDPQRTGWARDVPSIGTPRVLWKAQTGIAGYLNSPLVADDLVVVPSSGDRHNAPDARDGLHAVDLATGAPRWHAHADSDANGATLVGSLAVFTSDDMQVRAVDLATGTQQWSVSRIGAVYSTPLAIKNLVVVGDAGGNVVAITAETGAVAWERSYRGAIRGGLASDGKHIYVVSQGGDVAAIDPTGGEVWRRAVTRPGWNGHGVVDIEGYNAPVVDGTRLIVPFARDTYYDTGPALLALATTDGHEVWRASPGPVAESWGNLRSSPALADGTLLWAEPYSGDLAALDPSTGTVKWRATIGICLFPQYGSPVVARDVAYVPRQDGRLYAVEVDGGAVRWTFDLGQASHAGISVGGAGGSTGCEWDLPSGQPLYAPPALARDGRLFVATGEGWLFALADRGKTGPPP